MDPPATTFTQLAQQYWVILAASFVVGLIATPACRKVALRYRIVDRPDEFLKPHGRPIPYLGGVAIFLAWAVGICLAMAMTDFSWAGGVTFLIGGFAITMIGLLDDLKSLSPRVKLGGTIAVAIFLILMGVGDDLIRVIADQAKISLSNWLLLLYSIPLSLFIIVGACNATNLIDGLDGLCSGVLGITSIGFVVLAGHLAMHDPASEHTQALVVLSLAMLGASAGFLPYNRNPAKIFMGDAGSMLLGLNAAILILLFAKLHIARWMIGALMVFALPIADMLLTLVRRWRNGRPIMQGDRSHFYDQLVDRGYSIKKVVAISYVLTAGFAIVGCSMIFVRTRYAVIAYFATIVLVILLVARFKMVQIEDKNRD